MRGTLLDGRRESKLEIDALGAEIVQRNAAALPQFPAGDAVPSSDRTVRLYDTACPALTVRPVTRRSLRK